MKDLGRIKFGAPEALTDEIIHVWIPDGADYIVVERLDDGESIHIPRRVAKEVGRTIVKGQNP